MTLAACAGKKTRAPVEDRSVSTAASAASAPASAASQAEAPPLPGAENAGKPGYYTVKPGDRLLRIAMDNGQNWRDLVKWNNLENANVIEVGQVLRVVPPAADAQTATTRQTGAAQTEPRPIDRPPAAGSVASATPVATPSAPQTTPTAGVDDVVWAWPASGPVIVPFDDARSKGIVIGGKAGDPVFAAADGRVVYAGSGLRGYGNLLIVKHNDTYLTAYAHNQTLLVKEDQVVRRGQRIAEMGSTDADSVQLHFEIRRLGKPIDPIKLLPPR
ncbi:MAG: peptidoglycan DD-metalloendopeptidase family protein [Burkholderiales bacterium]